MRKILLGSAVLLMTVVMSGCSSGQQTADHKNEQTNRTSLAVEKGLNRGSIKRYVASTTYDKIKNTVDFHLTRQMSREMRGKRPNRYSSVATSFSDRNNFHQLIRRKVNQVRHQARNKGLRTKLIYSRQ